MPTKDSLPAKKPRHLLTRSFSSSVISLFFHCCISSCIEISVGIQLLAQLVRNRSQAYLCLCGRILLTPAISPDRSCPLLSCMGYIILYISREVKQKFSFLFFGCGAYLFNKHCSSVFRRIIPKHGIVFSHFFNLFLLFHERLLYFFYKL